MAADFNIAEAVQQAFGIQGLITRTTDLPKSPDFRYQGIEVVDQDYEVDRQSYLGTPVLHTLTFKGRTYKTWNEQGALVDFPLADFELPVVTFSNFRRASVISQTRIPGKNGSVIEQFGKDNWNIDIRGICLRDPSHKTATTARAQERKLVDFDNVAGSIDVVSSLYNDRDIYSIVIRDIQFGQLPGKPGTIPFTIRALSDVPAELILQ